MWSKLEDVFRTMGLDYSRQGSYTDDREYPPSFFTFWNFDIPEDGFFDNEAHRAVWYWQICYYTRFPETLYSRMDEFTELAKAAGFIVEGRGEDVLSDRPDYPGRMVRIKYIEDYQNQEVSK